MPAGHRAYRHQRLDQRPLLVGQVGRIALGGRSHAAQSPHLPRQSRRHAANFPNTFLVATVGEASSNSGEQIMIMTNRPLGRIKRRLPAFAVLSASLRLVAR